MGKIEFEITVCSVCGSGRFTPWLKGLRDRSCPRDEILTLVRCDECGHIYLNPRPTKSTLPLCYPPEYAPYHAAPPGFAAFLKEQVLRREVRDCMRHVSPPANVLEIGCAHGQLLGLLAAANFRVSGVELDRKAAERARERGLEVFPGELSDARFPDSIFDLVYMKYIIEHLPDVRGTLSVIRRILKPGGWLFIATPNADSPLVRWFGADAWDLEVPRHLNLYDFAGLQRQLAETGFAVRSLHNDPVPNSWIHTLGLRFQDRRWAERLFRIDNPLALLLLAPVSLALALVRQSSRIRVWAQRLD